MRRDSTPVPKDEPIDDDVQLAMAMSQSQYTGRAYDVQEQLSLNYGWNAIGIQTLMDVGSRATAEIFDEKKSKPQAKMLRSQLRFRHASEYKSFASSRDLGEQAVDDFRWWDIIAQPNPWQTGRQQRADAIQQLQLHGNCFIWNVKNQLGKTIWRMVLPVALLTPIGPGRSAYGQNFPMGGVRVHSLQWISSFFQDEWLGGTQHHYTANRCIPFEDLTLYARPHPVLRGDGFSPTSAGQAWMEMLRAAETSQRKQFSKNGNKKVLITPADDLKTTAELDAWQRRLDKRVDNSDSNFVVVPDANATEITVTPHEMAYNETAEQFGPMVLALHRVPKVAVGMSEGMTYGSVGATMQSFITLGVQPILDLMADEDTAAMQKEEGKDVKIEYTAPTYNDPELTEAQLQNDAAMGSITLDEAREMRGRKPWGGERGKLAAGSQEAINYGAPKPPMVPGMPAVPGQVKPTAQPKPAKPKVEDTKVDTPKIEGPKDKKKPEKKAIFAFDLDGAIQQGGRLNESTAEVMRVCKSAGLGVSVYTARDDRDSVGEWLDSHGVPWDGINEVLGADNVTSYIDDEAVLARQAKSIIASNVEPYLEPEAKARLNGTLRQQEESNNYQYFFIPVRGELAEEMRKLQKKIKPDDLAGQGLEDELHITVLYGVSGTNQHEVQQRLSMSARPHAPQFSLAEHPSVFGKEDAAERAVVVELVGRPLHELHQRISDNFDHIVTFPEYKPHITLGYVRSDRAADYTELSVRQNAGFGGSKLVFRSPDSPDFEMVLR